MAGIAGVDMDLNSVELTLEQQFAMRRYQDAARKMSREQAIELLLEATRQLMIKSNIIRQMLEKN